MIKLLVACFFYWGLLFNGLFAQSSQMGEGLKNVRPQKITLATCMDCIPFHYKNKEGRPDGLIVDLWKLWSQKTKIDVSFKFALWSETLAMVRDGKVDAHAGCFYSKERDTYLDYASKLAPTDTHIFTHESITAIKDLKDLSGFKIAILAKDFAEDYVRKNLPNAAIETYPDYNSLIEAAVKGEVRIFVADTPTALYLLGEKGKIKEFNFFIDSPLYSNDYYAAVTEGNDGLVRVINQGMKMISADERLDIERKWTSIDKKEKSADYIISVHGDYSPFSYVNVDGDVVGFWVDLWNLWAQKVNKTIAFKVSSWAETIENIKNGSADIHSGLYKNDERSKWMSFSRHFYQGGSSIFHHIDKSMPNNFSKLSGFKVGAIKGAYHEEILRKKASGIQLILYNSDEELVYATSEGEIDGFLSESLPIDSILGNLGLRSVIAKAGKDLFTMKIFAAVNKKSEKLIDLINNGLSRISKKEFSQLESRWITNPAYHIYTSHVKKYGKKEIEGRGISEFIVPITLIVVVVMALFGLIGWIVTRIIRTDFSEFYRSAKLRIAGLLTIFLSLTIVLLFSFINLGRIQDRLLEEVENDIEKVLNTTHYTLQVWAELKKEKLAVISKNSELSGLVRKLLKVSRNQVDLLKSPYLGQIRTFFKRKRKNFGDIGFFIIAPDLINIGSMRDSNVGTRNLIADKRKGYLEKALQGNFVFVPPMRSDVPLQGPDGKMLKDAPTMFFAGPINDDDGKVMAAFTIRLKPFEQFSDIVQLGRIRETGETYIFDRQGRFLSESRFTQELRGIGLLKKDQYSILNVKLHDPGINLIENRHADFLKKDLPLTYMAQEALAGRDGNNLEGYNDYRGVEVLGSWKWDKNLNIGITTEIDKVEALGLYSTIRSTLLITLAVTLFIAIFLTGFSLWIGKSANSSLTKARDELENRVEQRTEELKESKQRFELSVAGSGDALWEYDAKSDENWFSSRFVQLLGYEVGELPNTLDTWIKHLHHDDKVRAVHAFKEHIGKDTPYDIEYRLRTKQGNYIWVRARAKSLRGEDGKAYRTSGSISDITRRKLAQKKLVESERRTRAIIETAHDGLIVINQKGIVETFSPAAEKIFGYKVEEVVGNNLKMLMPNEIAEKHDEYLKRYLETGKRRVVGSSTEVPGVKKDGTVIPLEVAVGEADLGDEKIFTGIVRDISDRKKAEAELRKLSSAVEYSPATVVITDLDGQIIYVNPKFTEVTGYTYGEALGQNPRVLKSGTHSQEFYEELWSTIKSGREWRGEFQNKNKAGELYWESASISPIMNTSGEVEYFVAVKEDITERKKMEDTISSERARLQKILDTSPVGVAFSTKGVVRFANPKFVEMFGAKVGEPTPQLYVNPGERDELVEKLKTEGIVSDYELQMYNTNKETMDLLINYLPLEYEGDEGILGWLMDITHRKRAEVEREKQLNELADNRLAMLNIMEDLDVEKKKADEATKAKGDFLANMSHEIRTPINAVIGLNYLLQKTELTKKQKDYSVKVDTAAKNLLGVINDILDFSKIEAGKLDMEHIDFDLDDVLDNLSNVVGLKAQEKGLEFIVAKDKKVPSMLIGDPLRLGQILLNLVNNAIKFTEKGEILVNIYLDKGLDDKIKIKFEVKDTGIGMTPEQQDKLFQAFSQADTSTTRQFGGTGLGLSISKRLTEMMDGEIGAYGEKDKGSTFHFTAVFGLSEKKEKKRRIIPPILQDMRVLIVDDNETAREVLTDYCVEFTFECTAVASGKEAVSEVERATRAREKEYGLVLMDWQMPGMDGIETSLKIKEMKDIKQPKIIMVTAYGRKEVMDKAEEAGLDSFLIKPVGPSVLLDAIVHSFGAQIIEEHEEQKEELSTDELEVIKGREILLVEDNEINQMVAQEILQQKGLEVEIAENGKVAVEKVNERRAQKMYDCVLMDLQMPEMDGFEATKKIREDGAFKELPIVAMTADAMAGVEEEVLQVGMNDYLTKPIEPERLFQVLVKWIVRNGQEEETEIQQEKIA